MITRRRQGSRLCAELLLALLLIPLLATPASAAVSIGRAEVSGTRLRIEGHATASRTITVDGVAMGTSSSSGEFRIERDPYTRPADCTVDVNDGSPSPVVARLSGCTVASTPPPPLPPPPPSPPSTGSQFTSVSVAPATVVGGSSAVGTVTFSAPQPGASLTVTTDRPDVATATGPGGTESVVVLPGQSRGTFPVSTVAVTSPVVVTITAVHDGLGETRTTMLTVTPGTPAPSDTVRIRRAEWSAGRLRIEATSTNPNAILSVFLTVSNSYMFTLNSNGGGQHSAQVGWVFNPRSITVRSNFGGSATAAT